MANACFFVEDDARIAYLNTIGLSDFFSLIECVCDSDPNDISTNLVEVLLGCFHNLTNDNGMFRACGRVEPATITDFVVL